MKLGFIGLGIMGTPMALRLAKAGHALHVTTIGPVADELLKHGAQHLACARNRWRSSQTLFYYGTRYPQVAEVLFGEHGCAKAALKGQNYRGYELYLTDRNQTFCAAGAGSGRRLP